MLAITVHAESAGVAAESSMQPTASQSTAAAAPADSDPLACLDDVLGVNEPAAPMEDVEVEMKAFLSLPTQKRDMSPLDWWHKSEGQFPRLAAVARRCVPRPHLWPVSIYLAQLD